MNEPTCSTCKWWYSPGDRKDQGDCKANSPIAIQWGRGLDPLAAWPKTSFRDWCGNYETKATKNHESGPTQDHYDGLLSSIQAAYDAARSVDDIDMVKRVVNGFSENEERCAMMRIDREEKNHGSKETNPTGHDE